jgi:hypothetical protein
MKVPLGYVVNDKVPSDLPYSRFIACAQNDCKGLT